MHCIHQNQHQVKTTHLQSVSIAPIRSKHIIVKNDVVLVLSDLKHKHIQLKMFISL